MNVRARFVAVIAASTLAACNSSDVPRTNQPAVDIAAIRQSGDTPRVANLRRQYRGIGRPATAAEVRAWNIDVNGSGAGLPPGRGTSARGAVVFAQQCAACHGVKGEGIAPNPRLIGPEPRDFSFGRDVKLVHTIGNYWPYATTLYDYINRAMPFPTPGKLPPSDVYAVIAFLLTQNGVIDSATIIDARSLPRVRMPARDKFVLDNRVGGATFK